MELHISLIGRKDITGEIYRQLRRAIVEGQLRPGDPLPPSRELARQLTVSRTTVTGVYDRLSGEGFVTSRVGAGTIVAEHLEPKRSRPKGRQVGNALRPRSVWDAIRLPTVFAQPAPFDFRTGLPDAALFPHDAWRRLTARQLRSEAGGRVVSCTTRLRAANRFAERLRATSASHAASRPLPMTSS